MTIEGYNKAQGVMRDIDICDGVLCDLKELRKERYRLYIGNRDYTYVSVPDECKETVVRIVENYYKEKRENAKKKLEEL